MATTNFLALRIRGLRLHQASKIGGTLLWGGTVDTFKTLRIERRGPSNLFEVCITIISLTIPRYSDLQCGNTTQRLSDIFCDVVATLYAYSRPRLELTGIPPLSSHTQPLSCTHSTFFPGYRCFSEVCPASPAIQGMNPTPLSAEPCTMTTRPLKGGETTTLQVITITSPSSFPPLPNPTSSPAK